ncbi:MAG TPA: PLP-dependent aminotransferase family protein [Solirubrobacteraceae bacterium]|nr:PLP-dependent aminotransferase family protein [Solirubrobacteraceae bacterium]
MDLHLDLERATGPSRRARVENALRDGIRGGVLAPGARLPSSRVLSAQLGVSRGVVVDAYAQLVAEGYLSARHGAGTTVAATEQPPAGGRAQPPLRTGIRHDLSPFVPALAAFPRTAWRAALGRVLLHAPDERLGLPAGAGVPELRTALAGYLGRSRGVRTTAEEIVVTNGLRQGLGLLWPALAANGACRVAIESPGWRGVSDTAADAGLTVAEVPVDEHGLVVERLEEMPAIDAVVVAPAHQFPTGAVLSPERRTALVAWARRTGALVVEDDYDAEYRYDRDPIGSLQGLAPDHVVFGGSASKSLAPGLRLGWLVVPPDLAAPIAALQLRRGGMPSSLQQLALADLITRGELDRHLRRQRRSYRRRRDALLAELARKLPEVRVRGAAAGLFVVAHLPAGVDEDAVVAAARSVGVSVQGLGGHDPALVIGYANLSEAAVASAVDALAASVRTGVPNPRACD